MQRMDRLRRSLRDSFRRKREAPESSKPHQWQADEEAVRAGTCSFNVKYLGCVEVFESRGMQVCEEAMKVLRQSRRRPVKSVLFVSGDGLRVVEDDTKGLIVDQTIEKVSFCAPDRNHERGFSYICRDGTTRRWMCHGFLSTKDSGERLSHAVGCAFASCLDRKQKREKECGVSMTFDPKTSTFTRSGSFRVSSMSESGSLQSGGSPPPLDAAGNAVRAAASASNTSAIERPHAPVKMLERQGSFRGFTQLANQSPFKRQLSLRLSDLPSNLQRTQNNVDILTNNNVVVDPLIPAAVNASPTPPPRTTRNRLHSLPSNSLAGTVHSVIPETSAIPSTIPASILKGENKDLVSELCQQVSQGLSLLAANHDDSKNGSNGTQFPTTFTTNNPWDDDVGEFLGRHQPKSAAVVFSTMRTNAALTSSSRIPTVNNTATHEDEWTTNLAHNLAQNQISKPVLDKNTCSNGQGGKDSISNVLSSGSGLPNTTAIKSSSVITGSRPAAILPAAATAAATTATTSSAPSPPDYLPSWSTSSSALSTSSSTVTTTTSKMTGATAPLPHYPPGTRPPLVSTGSIAHPHPPPSGAPGAGAGPGTGTGTGLLSMRPGPGGIVSSYRGAPSRAHSLGADPFDADWATPVARNGQTPTNPFARQQTFQVSM